METKNLRETEKYQRVLNYIKDERIKRGIKEECLHRHCLAEPSAEAYGEGYIFVEMQLMHTCESCEDTWGLIAKDKVALSLAFNYIFFGKRG